MDSELCTPHRTERGRTHTFDPDSGWCIHGCMTRDDGRAVTTAGNTISPGNPESYQPDLLAQLETTT
jgi:hypothetical protein